MNPKKRLKVLDVGHYFIHLANQEDKLITNKKLQKLVYYAQAWSLVLNDGKKLFNESIEAWVHGPAVRSLYVRYKKFGFGPIEEKETGYVDKIVDETKQLLNEIWKVYGKLDAEYLEMLAHSEKPWQEAREELQSYENSENEISLETMKEYYSNKQKNNLERT